MAVGEASAARRNGGEYLRSASAASRNGGEYLRSAIDKRGASRTATVKKILAVGERSEPKRL